MDGNKRTELAAALVFLELNEYAVMGGEDELESSVRKVASGKMDKKGFASALKRICEEHGDK